MKTNEMEIRGPGHPTQSQLALGEGEILKLRIDGWIKLGPTEIGLEDSVLKFAHQIGEPRPSRKGKGLVEKLTPVATEKSHPCSLSARFGTGAFPFHTDTAHWLAPVRFVVLACVSPGQANRPTLILPVDRLDFQPTDRRLFTEGVFLVTNGRSSFYSGMMPENERYIRFDPGCMTPITSQAEKAWEVALHKIGKATPVAINWRPGDILLIDNWRTLHGRGDGPEDDDRLLLRVLVQTQSNLWGKNDASI